MVPSVTRTLIYVVAIPLAEDEDPMSVAVAFSERVDSAASVVANIRLAEASYEISPLGVRAALLDVTSKARNPL